MQPLSGITVVALEQAVAAPFATRQLADLGARVIKIERPDGDFARAYDTTVNGMASHFVWLNRSKESVALDLKQSFACEVMARLLERADVFIQNLAPGAAERLGLGTKTLRERYPRLIVCDITGYGTSGPFRDRKAYDLLVQSETGLLSITGTPDTPSKVGVSIADIAAGMYAYSGILSALLVRARTGEGVAVETSLFDALGEWMGYAAYYTSYSGQSPERSGAKHAAIAPYGPFDSSDGETIYLGIQNEREWLRFCADVLRRPDLLDDGRFSSNSSRVLHRAALEAIIVSVFTALSGADIRQRLEDGAIANAQMNTMQQFLDHPQLTARDRWRTVESPVGTLRALLPPVTIEGVEPVMARIPAVGENTEGVLLELGYDIDTIRAATGRRFSGVIL
jgi:crotonobetainyl-CoA:carnitine CoA-transferase CaiB-like acyl-CoA transferase